MKTQIDWEQKLINEANDHAIKTTAYVGLLDEAPLFDLWVQVTKEVERRRA